MPCRHAEVFAFSNPLPNDSCTKLGKFQIGIRLLLIHERAHVMIVRDEHQILNRPLHCLRPASERVIMIMNYHSTISLQNALNRTGLTMAYHHKHPIQSPMHQKEIKALNIVEQIIALNYKSQE